MENINRKGKENIKNEGCCIFEGMTSVSAVINAIKNAGAIYDYDRKIVKVYFDRDKASPKSGELGFLKRSAKEYGFEIELCDSSRLEALCTGNSHGGIAALCTERTIKQLTVDNISDSGYYAIIEGIEDPFNFGYSVRSLYASGADGIILTPRNWMSAAGTVAKSSAGTSELIPMYYSEVSDVAKLFRKKGYRIISAGIRDSVSLYEADLRRPLLLAVGGEKRGISRTLLDASDQIVRIDYGREFKGSLPTASAVSVFAFEILKQNRK